MVQKKKRIQATKERLESITKKCDIFYEANETILSKYKKLKNKKLKEIDVLAEDIDNKLTVYRNSEMADDPMKKVSIEEIFQRYASAIGYLPVLPRPVTGKTVRSCDARLRLF